MRSNEQRAISDSSCLRCRKVIIRAKLLYSFLCGVSVSLRPMGEVRSLAPLSCRNGKGALFGGCMPSLLPFSYCIRQAAEGLYIAASTACYCCGRCCSLLSAEGRKAAKRGRRKDCEGSSGRLSPPLSPPLPPLSPSLSIAFRLFGRRKACPYRGIIGIRPKGGERGGERLSARKNRPPPCRRSALSCYPLSLLAPFRLLCWLRAALVHGQRGRVPPLRRRLRGCDP